MDIDIITFVAPQDEALAGLHNEIHGDRYEGMPEQALASTNAYLAFCNAADKRGVQDILCTVEMPKPKTKAGWQF